MNGWSGGLSTCGCVLYEDLVHATATRISHIASQDHLSTENVQPVETKGDVGGVQDQIRALVFRHPFGFLPETLVMGDVYGGRDIDLELHEVVSG